ncbi:22225_t:CDS:1, partial [Racocetra persica]
RQRNDPSFYNLLQELRYGCLSENSKKMINDKIENSNLEYNAITSTHL